MRGWGLWLVLVGASGCTTVWTMDRPTPAAVDGEAATQRCDQPARELERDLRQRLTAVEEQLRAVDEVGEAEHATALREERLLLVVQLGQLSEVQERGSCGDLGAPPLDRDTLLRVARQRVVASRARDGRDADDGWLGTGQRRPFEAQLGHLGDDQGGEGEPPPPQDSLNAIEEETAAAEDEVAGGWPGGRFGGDAPSPPARASAAVVADAEPPVDLRPAVRRRAGAMGACFSVAERRQGIAIEVVARLAADGSMHVLRLGAEPGLTPVASDCLVAALEPVRVEAVGRSRVVTFPLTVSGE